MGGLDIRKYIRIFLNIAVPIAIIYAVCVWGVRLLLFFMPFVIGWIVAMIANPPVRFLEKRLKIVRKHGSAVLIVGVLALVILGLYSLTTFLMREMNSFLKALPGLFQTMQQDVAAALSNISSLLSFLPDGIVSAFEQAADSMGTYVGEFVQNYAASAGGAVARSLPDAFINVLFVLISSYMFLAEHDRILTAVRKRMPDAVIKYVGFLKRDIRTVIGGYFMAQFKIMFVVAVILFAGLLVLQVRYSFLIAIGIALLDFLPMFGTGTALIPWAAVKLITGEYAYAIGLLLLYVLTQVIRQIIQPKIVGDSMGLPPLTTLILLFLGFKFRGIAGMILAVPIGMVVIKFYEYGAFDSLIANGKLLIKEIGKLMREDGEESEAQEVPGIGERTAARKSRAGAEPRDEKGEKQQR